MTVTEPRFWPDDDRLFISHSYMRSRSPVPCHELPCSSWIVSNICLILCKSFPHYKHGRRGQPPRGGHEWASNSDPENARRGHERASNPDPENAHQRRCPQTSLRSGPGHVPHAIRIRAAEELGREVPRALHLLPRSPRGGRSYPHGGRNNASLTPAVLDGCDQREDTGVRRC